MSDIAAVLLRAFAAESAEHLQAIEPHLVALDRAGAAGVADLFRGFHSLKGLAGAMGRHGMEAVAHQAESVLGRVRDHGAPVTEAMVDALLAATDALRAGREATLAGEADRPPPGTLVAQLAAVLAHATAGAAGGVTGGATGGAGCGAGGGARGATAAPARTTADSGLGADEDMLPLFAEVMQGSLPELGAALTCGEGGRAALDDTLAQLRHAADVMDLDALSEAVAEAAGALSTLALPLDDAGRAALLPALRGLVDKAALLEDLLGVEAGAAGLRTALDAAMGGVPAGAGDGLGAALADLASAIRSQEGVAAAAARAESALPHAGGHGPAVQGLLALLGDVLPRLRHGGLVAGPALADGLARVGEDALDPAAAAGRAARLQAALAYPDGAPAGAGLAGPLMDSLTPEARLQVATALEAGQNAYALVLFLEDAPLVAGGLLAWVRTAGTMPGSRSVFHGSESWLEVLLLSASGPELLAAGLLQADPDRTCLRELRRLLPSGEVAVPLGVAAAPAAARTSTPVGELRVSGAALDRFMDVIAEARASLAALNDALEQLRAPGAARDRHDAAREQATRLDAQLRLLHGTAIDVRIVPVDLAFNRLPRVVRTLAREQGKVVDLQLEGREVRIDKAIVDRLIEPLLHMVRNAVDHGIEHPDERALVGKPRRARLLIRAVQGLGEVRITIGDDGRGLDRAAILARAVERGMVAAGAAMGDDAVHRLIFQPGFSTAAGVTETSGRGVGMDVVLTEVHRLGGEVAIETQAGQGARFTLRLPLTAATLPVLLVRAGGQCLGLPEAAVAHVLEVPRSALLPVDGRPAVRFGGQAVPVRPLGRVLWPGDPPAAEDEPARLVLVARGDSLVALEVDEIMRRQELLLLRLHSALADCPCLGGAAVLGNGEVVLSLDADQLVAAALASTWQQQAGQQQAGQQAA